MDRRSEARKLIISDIHLINFVSVNSDLCDSHAKHIKNSKTFYIQVIIAVFSIADIIVMELLRILKISAYPSGIYMFAFRSRGAYPPPLCDLCFL